MPDRNPKGRRRLFRTQGGYGTLLFWRYTMIKIRTTALTLLFLFPLPLPIIQILMKIACSGSEVTS